MALIDDLQPQLKRLSAELDRRIERHERVECYFTAPDPNDYSYNDLNSFKKRLQIPVAIERARLTKLYVYLMAMSDARWGKLIVDSKLDRLEVAGIRDAENDAAAEACWGIWQDNAMDLESKLGHSAALLDGRAHALIWPDENGQPEITLDDATQMVVEYREGSRRRRTAALRRWRDGGGSFATLYRPEAIYKFRKREVNESAPQDWLPRDEDWVMANPSGVVPVVEIAVNRRLCAGVFAHSRGEYEDQMGLMDRVNLLTFLGLVVALWMGFPLRGVIGDKIAHDDDGNALPPFDVHADSVFQFENPEAQLAEFKAADRGNLSIFAELSELAAATATPRHYFPMEGSISNVSESTIRAFEAGMHAKVNSSHKPSAGEGWEEVLRVAGRMLPEPVELSPRAEIAWHDHESRSLAERADAALKLGQSGLPWTAVAETALNFSQTEIARISAERSSDALTTLFAGAQEQGGLG